MPFLEKFSTLMAHLLDAVAPPRATEARVRSLSLPALHTIAQSRTAPYAPAVRTLLPYRHPDVRALVYEVKYRRNPRALALAGEILGEEIVGLAEDAVGVPLLIPIPMHPARRRERGYNQCEALCERIVSGLSSGRGALQYAPQALERLRQSTPQQKLLRRRRLANMRHAMRADPSVVQGRLCIVVDDVTTTGATLAECRRALAAAGAADIRLVALSG